MSFWKNIESQGTKINDEKGTEGGLYFAPGNYVAEIQRCKMIKTLKKDDAFVAEFKVIESDVVKIGPGSEPSFFVNMDGKHPKLALGNVADFMRAGLAALAAAAGEECPPIDEIELDTPTCEAITGADNILAGVKLAIYAFNKPTQAGKDFTRIKWRVVGTAVEA